jgi:hypothetical protein
VKPSYLYAIIFALAAFVVWVNFLLPVDDNRIEALKQRVDSLQIVADSAEKKADGFKAQTAIFQAQITASDSEMVKLKERYEKKRAAVAVFDADSSISFLTDRLSSH